MIHNKGVGIVQEETQANTYASPNGLCRWSRQRAQIYPTDAFCPSVVGREKAIKTGPSDPVHGNTPSPQFEGVAQYICIPAEPGSFTTSFNERTLSLALQQVPLPHGTGCPPWEGKGRMAGHGANGCLSSAAIGAQFQPRGQRVKAALL
jgi:hypothetical protein